MKRFTAFLLCAITVLTMIPSSLLSVIAADNGVIWNETQNQSHNNAATQAIPESVTIDGIVDSDTAWANNKWNEVDKNNGTWDTDSPAEESKENLTYKYQLHYDYEYFYGAIVLGKSVKDAEITVWLNDGTNAAGGYSHKISYTVSGGSVTDNGMKDYNGNAVADAELATQKYLVAYGSGDSVTIEFRRYLDSFTTADASAIQYFVSVKYNNDTLYFPKIKVEGELNNLVPSETVWPVAADGSNHLDHKADSETLSPITVDGKFDEAVWVGLTDFNASGDVNIFEEKEADKGTISFDEVKTNGVQNNPTNTDKYIAVSAADAELGDTEGLAYVSGVLSVNDGDEDIAGSSGTTEGVKFKYMYRVDGEYFYIAVVAEVPQMAWDGVTVGANDMNQTYVNNDTYYVKTEPNFTIQFYNQTNKYFSTDKTQMSTDLYDGWAVEHCISFESYKLSDDPNYSGAFSNINSRVSETNGKIINVNWYAHANDDTAGQDVTPAATGYQGAGYYQGEFNGFGVWNFECRIKIDAVLSSQNLENNSIDGIREIEDLGINVVVHDRRWLYQTDFGSVTDSNGKSYTLEYAYKAGDKWYYTTHYNRNVAWCGTNDDDQYDNDNLDMLTGIECAGNSVSGIVVDGNFDKRNNAALTGSDYQIDSTLRNDGYTNQAMQYTYIMAADYEYLYGAAVITNYTAGGSFRVWTKVDHSSTAWENAFDFSINKSTGEVTFGSWYAYEKGNLLSSSSSGDYYRDPSTVDVKVAWVKLDNGDVRFEFRIALSEIGCNLTLSPKENQKLLSYYVSMEAGSNAGLVHPRCDTIPVTSWDSTHEGRIFYKTPNAATLTDRAFDHNDAVMLDYISIDGKLEEKLWDSRITVQGDNGQWTTSPAKNDVFEYSYTILIGDNYIYGAVELDDEAVVATPSNGNEYTSIQLWLANPGAVDEWGVYANDHKFDNYFYNIYLCSGDHPNAAISILGPSGYMFGGSTPSVDLDYYKWGITTENGKTYAEFMIALDSYNHDDGEEHSRFNINEAYGADYYISVTHPTDTNETLTLTYPIPAEMFYLTHYDSIHTEGAGTIYSDLEQTEARSDEYLDSSGRWWTHVMMVPHTESGGWEIKAVKYGTRTLTDDEIAKQLASDGEQYKSHYGFLPSEINANPGCIIYCVNTGNNYIQVIEELKTNFEKKVAEYGYDINTIDATKRAEIMAEVCADGGGVAQYYSHEKKAAQYVNYKSTLASLMAVTIKTWNIGDIIKVNGLDPSDTDIEEQVQAILAAQTEAQKVTPITRYEDSGDTVTSYVDPDQTVPVYNAVTVEDVPTYIESGFVNTVTYEKVTQNTAYGNNLPTTQNWYADNCGTIDALEYITPEKIDVDGILNDTGWSEDGWITVDADINATVQNSSADEFVLKYQLRNDGEYLYVAAVYEGVAYNAQNSPNFWLWINEDTSSSKTFTKYFKVGYKWDGMETYALWDCAAYEAKVPALPDYYSYPASGVAYSSNFRMQNEAEKKGAVVYNNLINAIKNASGGVPDGAKNITYLTYSESAIFGYTDTVEESVGGRYYPDINLQIGEYNFGESCAVMASNGATAINGINVAANSSTVMEFRIHLDEIDAERDGFEYFVSAARFDANGNDYTMFYPNIYCEPDSDFSYRNYNMPFWNWYSTTAAKITADDYVGDMYMVNDYAPVVTLGAKFNDNFGENGSNAIRFGGLYTEDMIRRKSNDADNPGQNTTYWDVTEMGIVIAFTSNLVDDAGNAVDLKIDTAGAKRASAVGIVDWVKDTNFADYESFAFYVTVANMPDEAKGTKLSARTYICYRDYTETEAADNPLDRDGNGTLTHGTKADDYYGQTIVRSASMIEEIANKEIGNEQGSLPN